LSEGEKAKGYASLDNDENDYIGLEEGVRMRMRMKISFVMCHCVFRIAFWLCVMTIMRLRI